MCGTPTFLSHLPLFVILTLDRIWSILLIIITLFKETPGLISTLIVLKHVSIVERLQFTTLERDYTSQCTYKIGSYLINLHAYHPLTTHWYKPSRMFKFSLLPIVVNVGKMGNVFEISCDNFDSFSLRTTTYHTRDELGLSWLRAIRRWLERESDMR